MLEKERVGPTLRNEVSSGRGCTDFTVNAWEGVKVKLKKKIKKERKKRKRGRGLSRNNCLLTEWRIARRSLSLLSRPLSCLGD